MKTVIIKSHESETESATLDAESISKLDTKVYDLLLQKGPATRSQLSKSTGVARSTLYDSLLRLSLKGMVKKYSDSDHNSRGRPKVYFEAIK
jgi:predicted transcriptional regulator